jgi:uncharacterized protein YeaO (DUF488 family)
MNILIKRVYDKPAPIDGFRILVDRLWPRGISKEGAKIDIWLKSIAPSNELRNWYHHDVEKWPEFRKRYFAELETEPDAVNELLSYVTQRDVAFLFSAKELEHNNAIALKEYVNLVLST